MIDENREEMQKLIAGENRGGFILAVWILIILSLCLCSDSYSRNANSPPLPERFQEELSAGELMQTIMRHSIDIGFSSDSPTPDPYVKLGNTYAQLGHMELALVNYEKALEVARRIYGNGEDKRLADIYFNSARAYDDKLMHKEAVILYEKTIKLNPQFPNAKNLCSRILATSQDSAVRNGVRALELAKLECANSGWSNPAHLDTYAAAQALNRNFSKAIKWQRVAIELEKEEISLENFRQHLKFYQRRMIHRQKPLQPEPVTVKDARHARALEYFVKQYFVKIRDKPRNTVADSVHPDSMEAMKEGLHAVALNYAEDGEAGNQAKLKKLLEHLRLNAIAELKPLSRNQIFNKMNRIVVNHKVSPLTVYRPFKLRDYVFYSRSDSWNGWYGGEIAIDKISITKKGEIAIAVFKHLTLYGGEQIEHYTTLFLKEQKGSTKVLTVLTASKFLPDVVTKQFIEAREGIKQEKLKRKKEITSPHKFDMPAYIESLSSIVKKLGPDHLSAISTLIELYNRQGKHAKAEALLDQYLGLIGKKYGLNHIEMADSLNKLARFYSGQSDYAKAEDLLRQALAISEKPLDPTPSNVAYILDKLEEPHCCNNKTAVNEIRLKQSLAINEKRFGPNHARLADSLNDLAKFYGRHGKYAEAEPLFVRLLKLRKNVIGSENIRVVGSLKNLAEFYMKQGEHDKAETPLKRSLAIIEKLYGPNHSNVGRSLHDLANLYREQKNYVKAEPLLKRSLQISEKPKSPSYFSVVRSFNKLIELYCEQSDYAEAEPFIKRLLAFKEKESNPNLAKGGEVKTRFTVLAKQYSRQGDFAIAVDLRKRSLEINEQVFGSNDYRVAYSLIDLANLYLEQGDYAKAEPLLKRSLELAKIALYGSPDHSLMAAIIKKMTKLYRNTKRIPEAEKLERLMPEILNKWPLNRNRIRGIGVRAIQPASF